MKPFDLEKAKAGHPVQTRDRRPARIIATDRKGDNPIVALIGENEGIIQTYEPNGTAVYISTRDRDLFMAPVKRAGFINIYKGPGGYQPSTYIFDTETEAKENGTGSHCVATVRVDWEE